jgi:glycosyltransferase involved in cell wall biosynthesis
MARQQLRPDQWIVIDDGQVPTKPIVKMIEYVRRRPLPREPRVTLSLNLLAGIDLIRGDLVFVIEDDDYYAPDYIANLATKLETHEVVGIGRARYYHILTGQYYRHTNTAHASLGETAFRKSIIPDLRAVANVRHDFIDMLLWPRVGERGFVFVDEDKNPLHCSIKAMPGRKGASHGHNPGISYYRRDGGGRDDSRRSFLRGWTGEAGDIYVGLARKNLKEKDIMARVEQGVAQWNS